MDNWEENNHVLNVRLAKTIGLLIKTIDRTSVKFLGRNVYHFVLGIIMLYTCVISMVLIVSCPYFWADGVLASVDYGWKGTTALFLTYKIWDAVNHGNDIRDCLTITRYDFTSNSHRNKHILDRWRERSVRFTNTMVVVYLTSMMLFASSSLLFHDDIMTVNNHDGSVGNYRQNLLNLYLIVTDETYNAHYNTFYLVELLFFIFSSIFYIVFDFLLVSLCLAMTCQFQMVNAAFASVGNKSFVGPPHTPITENIDEKNASNEHELIYDELISIIMDHQAVIKKYYVLMTLFKRVMLLQVLYSSISLIVIWFTFIMRYITEDRFVASEVTTIKIYCTIPSISFQLFLVCSLFDNLHEQKDSVVSALYNSNWTGMSIKNKKLILLTMKMNNANQKKLKFTKKKIVNLELFYNIIRNSYSVVWVLVNYVRVKYE